MMAVRIKHVPAECTGCGEQTTCTIVDGDPLWVVRATLVALLAAGWKFVTYDKDDDDPRLDATPQWAACPAVAGLDDLRQR